MLIAGVIALCIVLLILAFLAPRLSRHPQHGADAVFGVGARGGSKAPGRLGQLVRQAVHQLPEGRQQERRRRAARRAARCRCSQPSARLTWNGAKLWATGISSMTLMLTCWRAAR